MILVDSPFLVGRIIRRAVVLAFEISHVASIMGRVLLFPHVGKAALSLLIEV